MTTPIAPPGSPPSSKGEVHVRTARLDDLDALVPLFDAYRQFYGRDSDPALAREFLGNRMRREESHILMAVLDGTAVGFTQLYRSFSSTTAARIFVLNDLYVVPEARRHGVGTRLLQAAAEFGARSGAVRLSLSTAVSNLAAQSAYERAGWKRSTDFLDYQLKLEPPFLAR